MIWIFHFHALRWDSEHHHWIFIVKLAFFCPLTWVLQSADRYRQKQLLSVSKRAICVSERAREWTEIPETDKSTFFAFVLFQVGYIHSFIWLTYLPSREIFLPLYLPRRSNTLSKKTTFSIFSCLNFFLFLYSIIVKTVDVSIQYVLYSKMALIYRICTTCNDKQSNDVVKINLSHDTTHLTFYAILQSNMINVRSKWPIHSLRQI